MTTHLKLHFFQKRFLQLQFIIIPTLILLSLTGYLFLHLGLENSFGLSYFFVDNEMTVTTWYSSGLLLLSAILLFAISMIQASRCKPYLLHWQLLTFIFLYLSLDESVAIHEKWGGAIKSIIKTGGVLYHAWVMPAIILVSVFCIFYWRFLNQLHPKTKLLFKLSGTIYITGAIGFEMISGIVIQYGGTKGLPYIFCTHFEEGLELLGLSVFLYGLLGYLRFILQNTIVYYEE